MIRRPPRSTLFPTRRSSDLGKSTRPREGWRDIREGPLSRTHFPFLRLKMHDLGFPFGSQAGEDLDRKSTRLNSSHLVISYAVFCLKKKNKNKSRAVER